MSEIPLPNTSAIIISSFHNKLDLLVNWYSKYLLNLSFNGFSVIVSIESIEKDIITLIVTKGKMREELFISTIHSQEIDIRDFIFKYSELF